MEQIESLLSNDWIKECGGAWGSQIFLATKPYQEHITDVDNLVWQLCVSYRGLNCVTNPFEYPIGRCDDAIENVGYSIGYIWCINLDSASGYNQVRVRKIDREKLALFSPDNENIYMDRNAVWPSQCSPIFHLHHKSHAT